MTTSAPGPWTVEKWADKQGSKGIGIKSADGLHIANMVMQLDDKEAANARLIAAAPELLEALKQIADPISYIQREAETKGHKVNGPMAIALSKDAGWLSGIARVAIARAEGKP